MSATFPCSAFLSMLSFPDFAMWSYLLPREQATHERAPCRVGTRDILKQLLRLKFRASCKLNPETRQLVRIKGLQLRQHATVLLRQECIHNPLRGLAIPLIRNSPTRYLT
jgi:hypothetical protein